MVPWLLRSFSKYWCQSESSSSVFSTLVPSAFFTLAAAFDFPLSESSLTTLQTTLYWFFSAACLSSSSLFSRCFLSSSSYALFSCLFRSLHFCLFTCIGLSWKISLAWLRFSRSWSAVRLARVEKFVGRWCLVRLARRPA